MNKHPGADQRRERACVYLRAALDNLNKGLSAINNHPEFGEQRDLLLGWALEVGALERNLRSGALARSTDAPGEPVAFQYWTEGEFWRETSRFGYESRRDAGDKVRALYTTPPAAATSTPCASGEGLPDVELLALFNKATGHAYSQLPRGVRELADALATRTPTAGNTEDARSMGAVRLQAVSDIAHYGGLCGLSADAAMDAIRGLTLPEFRRSATLHEAGGFVRAALAQAASTGGAAS